MSANYSLVLLLWQSLNHKWVKNIGLLAVKLVIGLVVGAFSQLGSLFTGTILGPGTDEVIWLS